MAISVITSANDATVAEWSADLLREALYGNPLSFMMGQSASSAIVTVNRPAPGGSYRYSMTPKLGANFTTETQTAIGNGDKVEVFTDTVTVGEITKTVTLNNIDISQQRTVLDLREIAGVSLRDWVNENLRDTLLANLTDVTTGRTRARYIYGNSDLNWNTTHATAVANVDAINDRMSVALIGKIARLAKYSGLTKIAPMTFEANSPLSSLRESYVLLLHPRAARDLAQDEAYASYRVMNNNGAFTGYSFNGTKYMGTIEGVAVYEMPDPNNIMLDANLGAGSIPVAHNVLLGRQAAMVAWPMAPEIRIEETDLKRMYHVAAIQLRGSKKCVFRSEDFGVVHAFTAAVVD